jgi:ligand-binding sensor domain-containing protein
MPNKTSLFNKGSIMEKILCLLFILISLTSCEKSDDNPRNVRTDFNHKILDGYFVISIAFDNQGNAWIGTFKQGLIKYNSNGTTVYNFTNSIIPDTSVIYDIAVDSKDNIWIGCEGLIKLQGNDFIQYNSTNTPIPEDFVSSIAIDSKDNIWFTSCRFRQGGIVKYDGTNWAVYKPDNSELPANFVKSIAIDNNDNVWLALNEIVNKAYLVRIKDDNWRTYTSNDLGFSPYYFSNIQINSKNELCGAIDYSLSSLAFNNGPQVFIFDGKSSSQLQYDNISNVKSITVDNEDNIWCTTYGGYAVFDGEDWAVDNTSFKEHSVFAIEQASDNSIWIGTGDGIYIND